MQWGADPLKRCPALPRACYDAKFVCSASEGVGMRSTVYPEIGQRLAPLSGAWLPLGTRPSPSEFVLGQTIVRYYEIPVKN